MTVSPWDSVSSGLRSLLGDLVGRQPPQLAEECARCQLNLDLYVSDELDGVAVRDRHPHVWQHLQACAACRAVYDGLVDLLTVEAEGRLAELPPQPAFAGALPAPWLVKRVPEPGNAVPALVFLFASAYLRRCLGAVAAAGSGTGGARMAPQVPSIGESAPAYQLTDRLTDRLVLSYLGDLSDPQIAVQLYARPDRLDATALRLSLIAVGEPRPVTAELTWAGRTWTAVLGPDGDAVLGPVPAGGLSDDAAPTDAFSLRLSF